MGEHLKYHLMRHDGEQMLDHNPRRIVSANLCYWHGATQILQHAF